MLEIIWKLAEMQATEQENFLPSLTLRQALPLETYNLYTLHMKSRRFLSFSYINN